MRNIDEEIEKTLESWNNVKRFEANPFLYALIEQRIKNLDNHNFN